MKKEDVRAFIEIMKAINEDWTPEQVEQTYGHLTLREAVKMRQNGLQPFFDFVEEVVKKDLEQMENPQP